MSRDKTFPMETVVRSIFRVARAWKVRLTKPRLKVLEAWRIRLASLNQRLVVLEVLQGKGNFLPTWSRVILLRVHMDVHPAWARRWRRRTGNSGESSPAKWVECKQEKGETLEDKHTGTLETTSKLPTQNGVTWSGLRMLLLSLLLNLSVSKGRSLSNSR
jgi:hypothetical protein